MARLHTDFELSAKLTRICMRVLDAVCDVGLHTYQKEVAERIFFSLIYGDGEEITILSARQSGKSEALACTAVTAMIMLPRLAQLYPEEPVLQKFRSGLMVGVFGPVDFQSENLYSRIKLRFESEKAIGFLRDPEIDDETVATGSIISLKRCRSFCRKQTAHPQAKIESSTYHLIIIDEAQDADTLTVRKSIHPMMVAVNGTIVKTGTATSHKSDFYEAILRNKRRSPMRGQKNHLEFDYKRAIKENVHYNEAILKEKQRLGEDSDEFQMAFCLKWLLDRGMFITDEQLDLLGDKSMQIVPYYYDSPIVLGVDVAAKHDSTVVTAVFVDWEHPDEFGLFHHVVLNWMELHGENWESQYRQIVEFCGRYSIMRMGVDAQGMGGPVAERLQVLLPNIEVVPLAMNPGDQSERWQHLMQLIQREKVRWPAHVRTRRLMTFRRFTQQMAEVEKEYKGRYIAVAAPKGDKNAHDDYIDSLALACSLTKDFGQIREVEQMNYNPLLERSIRR